MRRFVIFGGLGLGVLALANCDALRPMHALAPKAFGLTCGADNICIDDLSRLPEARALTQDALAFVNTNLGKIETPPRVLFCSTQSCFANFGDTRVAALYLWGFDTLMVNHIGWEDHILRHELIHHWQSENIGVLRSARLPGWYIEGMAYVLSEDPRPVIPNAEACGWRAQFAEWIADGNDWRVVPD